MQTELIDRIYEAAVTPELWPDVLQDLAQLTDAKGGLLFAVRDQVLNWTSTGNLHEAFATYVNDGYFRRCGRRICLFRHAHSSFLTERDYWTDEELESNEIYQNFFRPRDLGWSAGTGVANPTGDNIVFSIERTLQSGPMEKHNVEQLNDLRPHLARSALVAARIGLKSAKNAADTFAKLGLPALLLTADGSIVDAHNMSEDLATSVSWRESGGASFSDTAANDLLREALKSLQETGAKTVRSFPIRNEADDAIIVAHVLPITRSAQDLFANSFALLVLVPVGKKSAPPVELIRSLFDLTAAEARVARSLAAGVSVEGISEDGGVSVNTVRTQIRKIMEKTGCARQAEVVALMANIALPK